jgi:hypothetical protein
VKIALEAAMFGQALALCATRDKRMPVLAQLVAGSSAVSIATGDGSISVKATVDATIFEPGAVAVSADRLGALVANLAPGATVLLTAGNNSLAIASGNSRYRLPLAESPADLSIGDKTSGIEISAGDALKLCEPIAAAGTETTRVYLTGIFLHSSDDVLYAVGTNGIVLIRSTIEADELTTGVIIPSASVTIVARLIKRTKPDKVTLRRAGTLFEVSAPNFRFTTRTIDAIFPDYARVIPHDAEGIATCAAADLTAALARLGAIANGGPVMPLVALVLSAGKLKLFLPRQPDDGADAIVAEVHGQARIALALPALGALVAEFRVERLRLEVKEERALVISDGDGKIGVLTSCRWNFGEAAALSA